MKSLIGLLFVVEVWAAEAPSPATPIAGSFTNKVLRAPIPPLKATAQKVDQKPSSSTTKTNAVPQVEFITTAGRFVVELWPDAAPKTVQNFLKLVRQGFYNGTCFHRIIPGVLIQGGDPLTKDESKRDLWGTGGPGYTIPFEKNDRHHTRGVISMAHGLHPDSGGSQFFICLGEAGYFDGKYTAFGKVVEGIDVVEKIGQVPVTWNRWGTEKSLPKVRIVVQQVRLVSGN